METSFAEFLKRTFDLTVSLMGLIICIPLFAFVTPLIWLTIGTPVFFRQPRAGLKGKPFLIAKFRTMRELRDAKGDLLPDGDRLTAVGKFLRSTSLDELPQLWNVLKGEMSLVGPRPLLLVYVSRYSPRQAKRLDVKPGITGLAQVKGRNALSWEDKFEWDVRYCESWTFFLDIKILFLSVVQVFSRQGISADNHSTMPEFMGSSERDRISRA